MKHTRKIISLRLLQGQLQGRKKMLQNDIQNLENSIFPKYEQIAEIIPVHKATLDKRSAADDNLVLQNQEVGHHEIDAIIQRMQSDIDDTNVQLAVLDRPEKEIHQNINEISQVIINLRKIFDTSYVPMVSEYNSRNKKIQEIVPTI